MFVMLIGKHLLQNLSCCVYILVNCYCCHRAVFVQTYSRKITFMIKGVLKTQPFMHSNALISPFDLLTFRGDADLVGQSDEDQGTDNEICTVASGVDSEGKKCAPGSEFDKTEGLYSIIFVVVIHILIILF